VNLSLCPSVEKLEGWDMGVFKSFYVDPLVIKRLNMSIIVFANYFVQ
jgi:hypothetical protein